MAVLLGLEPLLTESVEIKNAVRLERKKLQRQGKEQEATVNTTVLGFLAQICG